MSNLIPQDWFDQILAKVNDSDFDKGNMPDRISITAMHGDQELAHWDLTEELLENGIARINYTNSTLNVDHKILFVHEDLKEKLADDEIFQNFLDQTRNISSELGYMANFSVQHEKSETYGNLVYAQGTLTLLVGIIGLIAKLKGPPKAKVVRVTGYAHSIWCIVTGILMLFEQISRLSLGIPESKVETIVFIMSAYSSVLLKALLVSFKLFTIVVYLFQNIMIYRPFFFRRHKKAISRWVLAISTVQSAVVFIVLITWSIVLVFYHEDDLCHELLNRTHGWRQTVVATIWGGYLGSLFLSLIFFVGFYRQSAKKVGSSDKKNVKKTMVSCSIEILFDVSALVAVMTGQLRCGSLFDAIKPQQPFSDLQCDISARVNALDSERAECILKVLALQPTVQEIFTLLAEVVENCSQ